MHSILLASQWPSSTGVIDKDLLLKWSECVSKINTIAKRNLEIQLLGHGVWLILGGNGLSFLGEAAVELKEHRVPYQTIVIDQVSDWTNLKSDEGKISWVNPS